MMRQLLALLCLLTACGSDATSATATTSGGTTACKHPTTPKDKCQERWCDNPLGVGMPCTKGGSECLANEQPKVVAATLCTANFSESDAFCTLPCVDDEDCGKGAQCVGDPANPKAGKGCMLTACLSGGADVDASSSTNDVSATDGK